MRPTKLSLVFLGVLSLSILLLPFALDVGVLAQGDDPGAQVAVLLEARCAKCHGPDSRGAGGMNYILDTAALIGNEIIKPGLPKESKLYEEVEEGKMPADDTAPLPEKDIELIAAWITGLAPDAAGTVEEEVAAKGGDLFNWLGKFHPVLVHFPIALILIAGLFELLSLKGGALPFLPMQDSRRGFTTSARLCLLFGALFGIAGASLGWLNAADHFFAANLQDDLFWHRWLGTTLAVIAVLALIFSEIHHRALERGGKLGAAGTVYRLLLFAGCVLIIVVGHLGGTLVFGEGYYNF
jgi:uncharacterized membrane protein/mono/diheme cytochrome c family protein